MGQPQLKAEQTEWTDRAKLFSKICALIKGARAALVDDDMNNSSGYKFVSYKQLNIYLGKAQSDLGIVMMPSVKSVTEERVTENYKMWNKYEKKHEDKTRTWIRSEVHMTMELIDVETGFSVSYPWISCDQDYGGKSVSKAQTEAVKRFWFKILNVHGKGVEDDDPDSTTTDTPEKPQQYNHTPKPDNVSGYAAQGYNSDSSFESIFQCLRDNYSSLSTKERDRIISIKRDFESSGSMSEKQMEYITRLANKFGGPK